MQKRRSAELRSLGEDAYFVASNSARGFCSYYGDCFDDARIKQVYVIKGGPGTGKSRFMREVSDCAISHGWQRCMIYCSSDADSLDGVILRRGSISIALLDGTSPHVYEPKMPGVREELINLGDFWNGEMLRERSEEIARYQREKADGYRRAYRYLAAFGEVYQSRSEKLFPYIRKKAISDCAAKLMHAIPDESTFEARMALMESVGMGGVIRFDTYAAQAKRLYLIGDCRGTGKYLMDELYRLSMEKRLRVRLSRDPILPDVIDGLFLVGSGVAFVIGDENSCEYAHQNISMRRFLKVADMKSVRSSVNFDQRMLDALLGETLEQMQVVKRAHFELERIYSSAMNFEEKEEFTKKFCNRLFDLQNS